MKMAVVLAAASMLAASAPLMAQDDKTPAAPQAERGMMGRMMQDGMMQGGMMQGGMMARMAKMMDMCEKMMGERNKEKDAAPQR